MKTIILISAAIFAISGSAFASSDSTGSFDIMTRSSSDMQGQRNISSSSNSPFPASLFDQDQTAEACEFVKTQRETYCDTVNRM